MDQTEIKALINLLDDPDEVIFNHIRERILSIGQEVIPELESAWETSFDSLLQQRIEIIIHTIQYKGIFGNLSDWAKKDSHDLLEGAILIAKYQYPDLDEKKLKAMVQQIRQDAWLELNPNLTALEKVRVLNHIFFELHGFSGNTVNYHAPQNSYINNVLESKKGNPLSLSILYTVIAQSLGLPIYGVNLPEHFILAFRDESKILPISLKDHTDGILFYINPFSKGSVFSKREIDAFLKQLKLEPQTSFYEPCSNITMIKRLIRNLMFSYEKLGYPDKKGEMEKLLAALDFDPEK